MLENELVDSRKRAQGSDLTSPVKKARVCFTIEEELTLLQLVLKHNPYADQSQWPKILDLLHVSIEDKAQVHSMRSVKDKIRSLSRDFKTSANKAQMRRFGTSEQYMERRALLAGVVRLQENYKGKVPAANYNSSRSNEKNNEFSPPECTVRATVPPGNYPELDGVAERKMDCPEAETSASNASDETFSEQARDSRAGTRSTDLEVKKLQIQERTLDLREQELQTMLKQQELLTKQLEILERTTVIFMQFIDKMTTVAKDDR